MNKINPKSGFTSFILFSAFLILFLYGNSFPGLNNNQQNKPDLSADHQKSTSDTLRCATTDIYNLMLKENPEYEKRQQILEEFTKNYIKNIKPGDRSIVTIPVVFHIVYKTPQQNVSNPVVQSQIDVLNKDFRRLNDDTINTPLPFKHLGGDAQIEFVLAKRDPQGNPTNGITRTLTSRDVFIFGEQHIYHTTSGGRDIWDRDKYLNFWVCALGGGVIYGYGQYPGYQPTSDGVVMNYISFGSEPLEPLNSNGRVATHEVGHWFNLRHIFGDTICGNDFVDDTPTQKINGICRSFPHISCNNGPYGDMFMNYMDYATTCRNIFTIGQTNRMNAALYGIRSSLLTSDGGVPVSGALSAHFRSDKTTINYGGSVKFLDESGGIPTSWQWTFDGGVPSTSNVPNPVVTYPTGGFYSVKLKVSNSFGTDSVNYINYIKVLGVRMLPFSLVYPRTNTFMSTNSTDTASTTFTWTRSTIHPTIKYKWKLRNGLPDVVSYTSNNNGSDTAITLRNSLLDSIVIALGGGNDTITCAWRVFAYNGADSSVSQNQNYIYFMSHTIGIQVISTEVPHSYKLEQNYPNPFNPTTKFKFSLPVSGNVMLKIFDVSGREVTELVNRPMQAGTYEVDWDASAYSSGVYFYAIISGRFTQTRKMVLIK